MGNLNDHLILDDELARWVKLSEMYSNHSDCNSVSITSKKQSIKYLTQRSWHPTQIGAHWNEMLKAKLKMPVIQSKELFSFNNKLIEADEKFSILGKKKKILKLINFSKTNKQKNPKLCCSITEVLISSAKLLHYSSQHQLFALQEYWSAYSFISNHSYHPLNSGSTPSYLTMMVTSLKTCCRCVLTLHRPLLSHSLKAFSVHQHIHSL